MESSSSRAATITLITFLLALIAGSILIILSRPAPVAIAILPPEATATPQPTATPRPMQIYVTGAVQQPDQIISLPVGSRVQDAISAAGGLADTANPASFNPVALLRDGDQVHVATILADTVTIIPTSTNPTLIPINTATIEELQSLPGIGASIAQRIIDYRTENGDFKTLEDLDAVSGIGPGLLTQIADLIRFD